MHECLRYFRNQLNTLMSKHITKIILRRVQLFLFRILSEAAS